MDVDVDPVVAASVCTSDAASGAAVNADAESVGDESGVLFAVAVASVLGTTIFQSNEAERSTESDPREKHLVRRHSS